MSTSTQKFEKYVDLYKTEQVKKEKTLELNEILSNTNIEVFIEPNTNNPILYSKENGQPMFKILEDTIKEFQKVTKKLNSLKTFFESVKDSTDCISHGYISTFYKELKFIYKNLQIEMKFKDNQLFIESNFKFKKQTWRNVRRNKIRIETQFTNWHQWLFSSRYNHVDVVTHKAHRASPDKRFFCLPKANDLIFVKII